MLNPKLLSKPTNEQSVAVSNAIVKKTFQEYEKHLTEGDPDQKYLLFETLTLADFVLGFALIGTNFTKYDFAAEFPRLRTYQEALEAAHPFFKQQKEEFIKNLAGIPE